MEIEDRIQSFDKLRIKIQNTEEKKKR